MEEKIFVIDKSDLPCTMLDGWTYLYDYPAQIPHLEIKLEDNTITTNEVGIKYK